MTTSTNANPTRDSLAAPSGEPAVNRQILLRSRPEREASKDNFELVSNPLPALKDGQVLVRNHYLSLDPYMRGRMSDAPNYAPPQALGEVMLGGTVGQVVESRSPKFSAGDFVSGLGGWQEYFVVDGATPNALRKVRVAASSSGAAKEGDVAAVPLSAYLGAAGMPGVTAWYGLTQICAPERGQTVVVSAASGAVGSVVGQLAKRLGCRVVGIAGGPAKCGYVVNELGFDACVDYKAHTRPDALRAALHDAAPDGIDCDFENVGGPVFDAVLSQMNAHGRVALCGMVSRYDGDAPPLQEAAAMLTRRLTVRGFIVAEHMALWPEALALLVPLVASGELKTRESIADGLENAPDAFLGMLKGRNFGKQLVKLV